MTLARRTLSRCLPVLAFLTPMMISVMTFAAGKVNDVDAEEFEARLEGYATPVRLESPGSTAPYWLLLAGLGVVALIVMFKDAKRTHLD